MENAIVSDAQTFSFENLDSHHVVALLPELNKAPWGEVDRIGETVESTLHDQREPLVLIDLSALDFMGSEIVALLVRIWKCVRDRGGQTVIVTSEENIREVIELAGLSSVWTLVDSRDEALHELGLSPEAVVKKRETRMLEFVGPLALLLAGGGLAAYLLKPNDPLMRDSGLKTLVGCSTLGLVASAISVFREQGLRRILSVLVLLASAGLLFLSSRWLWEQLSAASGSG